MANEDKTLLAFNRGVIDPKGLARIDLERMAMSAATQHNWMPRVLGSMIFRPGFEYIDNVLNDVVARQLPFTFSADDTATLEVTNGAMRVRVDDELIVRPTVTATVQNSTFTALTNWTDRDEAGCVSTNVTDADFGTFLSLIGTGELSAGRSQNISITETGTEHALHVRVIIGQLTLRVGSGNWVLDGNDDFIPEVTLGRGNHSLSFTPDDDCYILLSSSSEDQVGVGEVSMEAAGAMSIVTPWGSDDLPFMRWEQSGDVIYVAAKDTKQAKIERRAIRSWSVVDYAPENGPFKDLNVSAITITPSVISGSVTLTASKPLFELGHAESHSLFRIGSQGQTVSDNAPDATEVFTDSIRVTGTGDARQFGIIVEGTFVATVTVQFSFTNLAGSWNDLGTTYTAFTSTTYNDGQDSQIIYYRIGVKTGDWTSGTVTFTLTYTGGSIQGVVRVDHFTDNVTVTGEVLKSLGAITATADWQEGEWSTVQGYPSAVSLLESRLWWGGNDKIFGSLSDGYEDWDDNVEGDSSPIRRNIGFGPQRVIHWMLSMGRLLFGTSDNSANVGAAKFDGNSPLGARSNSFDEPLTQSNFNIKSISSKGLFVDRTGQRLYEMNYNLDEQDYKAVDLSIFAPDFNSSGIVQIAVQMKPDIRIHCVRNDGTCGILVFDRLENVICWVDVSTADSDGASGFIEDVSVLPNPVSGGEDQVYYIIARTINAATERHLCKWALESEVIGGTLNKQMDSFTTYSGAPTVNPFATGELLHLRGETVVVWADGVDNGTDTVTADGKLAALSVAVSDICVGLAYTGQFKSAKLGRVDGIGLMEHKKINQIGFIAENIHYQGLQYGPDFDNLSDMPLVEHGQVTVSDQIWADYHEEDFSFGGEWSEDSRICLQAASPRPVTILATIAEFESVEGKSNKPRRARR